MPLLIILLTEIPLGAVILWSLGGIILVHLIIYICNPTYYNSSIHPLYEYAGSHISKVFKKFAAIPKEQASVQKAVVKKTLPDPEQGLLIELNSAPSDTKEQVVAIFDSFKKTYKKPLVMPNITVSSSTTMTLTANGIAKDGKTSTYYKKAGRWTLKEKSI